MQRRENYREACLVVCCQQVRCIDKINQMTLLEIFNHNNERGAKRLKASMESF